MARQGGQGGEQLFDLVFLRAEQHVAQPERQAVDDCAGIGGRFAAQRVGELQRRFDRTPCSRPPLAVVGDALGHFGVAGFAGGDVGDGQAARARLPFRVAALARTGAAEDEFDHAETIIAGDSVKGMPCNSAAGPPL